MLGRALRRLLRAEKMLLLLALLVSSAGCSERRGGGVEEASRRLATAWAESAAASAPRSEPERSRSSQPPLLLLDASRSMAGFAGCINAPTEFNTTIDRLTSDLSITRVVRFGEKSGGSGAAFEEVPLSRAVHCKPFYDRLQNPDYALFQRARDDSTRRIYIYVTDGVQSDWMGPNPGPSLRLLKEWLEQGRALGIAAFRSRFSGAAWSEQGQRMIGSVDVARRPFYAFVLAHKDNEIDELLRQVSPAALRGAELIRFSADAVGCSASVSDRVPKYRQTAVPPWAWVRHGAVSDQRALVKYDCAITEEYPLAAVRPRSKVEYRGWNGREFDAQPSSDGPPLRADSSMQKAGGASYHLVGTLPFDNKSRYGIYHFRLDPEPGEMRAALQALSTDSDVSPESFEKTYRFSWVIEQLARVHLARNGWTPFSLTVQYR